MGKTKAKKKSSSASKPKKQSDSSKPKKKQWPKGNWDSGDHLSSELKGVGLRVKEVVGDGNCCFRAIGDQLEGDKADHRSIRKKVCQYIEDNREMFEPFIEDDEPFDTYLKRMRKDGSWAGQIELQAASLALEVNICIYQYQQPRWTLSNFPENEAETIHISYHDGEHYNSVRGIEDFSSGPPAPFEIKKGLSKSTDWDNPSEEDLEKELLVSRNTGCDDRELIRKALTETKGNVDDAVEKVILEMNGIKSTEDTNMEVEEQTIPPNQSQNEHILANQTQLNSIEQSDTKAQSDQTSDQQVESDPIDNAKSLTQLNINSVEQICNCNTELETTAMDVDVDLKNNICEQCNNVKDREGSNQQLDSQQQVENEDGNSSQNGNLEADKEQNDLKGQKDDEIVSEEESNEVEEKKKGKKSGKKQSKKNLTNQKKNPRNKPCHCGSGRKYKNCHLPIELARERRNENQPIQDGTENEAAGSNSVYFQEVVSL
eukprot:TRINITY_DN68332_c0_g2_i2.p2 TRINITY_DN68332_c0_g2~~TRINITY_DN68332_c0_g2_i2.p2  ORF type:complete len:487 (-),score=99.43 TRINITY_DN68332_c0_g2_i2:813-2273(-)